MADLNVNVPGIEKLIDHVASGIGSVAGPMLAPWRAEREAKARLIAAQGTAEELAVLAQSETKALQMIAEARKQISESLEHVNLTAVGEAKIDGMVAQRVEFQEAKRQSNIGRVVALAANELGDETVEDRPPDHDWTARFFSDVQDVTNEDMQFLWARVLAGQVKRPGSTSLRTLSVLRNLDQSNAQLFVKLYSLSVTYFGDLEVRTLNLGNYDNGNGLGKYGLDYSKLNDLHENELITADYNSWRDFTVSAGMSISDGRHIVRLPFEFQGVYWVLDGSTTKASDQKLRLHGVALSRAGRELAKFVDIQPDDAYRRDLSTFFDSLGFRMVRVHSDQPQVLTS